MELSFLPSTSPPPPLTFKNPPPTNIKRGGAEWATLGPKPHLVFSRSFHLSSKSNPLPLVMCTYYMPVQMIGPSVNLFKGSRYFKPS